MSVENFITDYGTELAVTDTESGEIKMTLPRYGAWIHNEARGKHEVAQCSNDLEALKKATGIERVIRLFDRKVFSLHP